MTAGKHSHCKVCDAPITLGSEICEKDLKKGQLEWKKTSLCLRWMGIGGGIIGIAVSIYLTINQKPDALAMTLLFSMALIWAGVNLFGRD